jgi:hypothetical protein
VLDDPTFFTQNDISWVLSLGPAAPSQNIKLAGREQVNLPDAPSSNLGVHFKKIVLFIAYGRHVLGHNVYVHCAAGISRSTTSLCAYLMVHLGLGFDEILRFLTLRRKSVCPNEGFRQQLKDFERSRLRNELAQELRKQCQWYDEVREADLEAVRRQLSAPAQPQSPSKMSTEKIALANAMKTVQAQVAAAQRTGKQDPKTKLGDGSSVGDYGLGWLMNDRKSPPRDGSADETRPTRGKEPRRDSRGPEQSRGRQWSLFGASRR